MSDSSHGILDGWETPFVAPSSPFFSGIYREYESPGTLLRCYSSLRSPQRIVTRISPGTLGDSHHRSWDSPTRFEDSEMDLGQNLETQTRTNQWEFQDPEIMY